MYKTAARKHKRGNHQEFDLYGDLEKIKSALYDTTHDIKGKAKSMITDSYEDVKERSLDVHDKVVSYVTHKPLKALGWAALAGILTGLWVRR
jgi:ElaB/YqjD/DUF883 family membrane-anchored ribosome-binding protein